MHLFELAEDLKLDVTEVSKYLKGIGYIVRNKMDVVSPDAASRARTELAALAARKSAEKKAKEDEQRRKRAEKRDAERKEREKAAKEKEKKAKEEDRKAKERQKIEKAAKAAEAKKAREEAAEEKKRAEAEAKKAKAKAAAEAAEAKKKAAQAQAAEKAAKAAKKAAPKPAEAPAAKTPEKPAQAPVPSAGKPADAAPAATQAPEAVKAAPAPPAAGKPAPHAPPRAHAAEKAAEAKPPAQPAAPREMVPLDRIKKSLSRAEEIKSSLEAAQSQALLKRYREEREAEAAKTGQKRFFISTEDREQLINRPHLSASAKLRQVIADRTTVATEETRAPRAPRVVRKRKHAYGAGQRPQQQLQEIAIAVPITVREFSQQTGIKVGDIIRRLMLELKKMATINDVLDRDSVELLGLAFNLKLNVENARPDLEAATFAREAATEGGEAAVGQRPPVVTFMGHVDHGKTSLLDAIRQAKVALGESGGITQHVGAYEVATKTGRITFIDTPGHEAFTAMRARGAHVTDIAVLVVAADDGVMPQTLEALSHARAARVPVMVAVNKIDLPAANVDRVLRQLAERGLNPEDWGGETICCRVSALTKEGIDHLLEMICLQADMLELKARMTGPAEGVVLEAELDPGKGATVTLLVQQGVLNIGDTIVCGAALARARALLDYRGEPMRQAAPSQPVIVLGFSDVPAAGSPFRVASSEKHARDLVEERRGQELRRRHEETRKVTLESFYRRMSEDKIKELPLVIKGDTQGTTEALRGALERLSSGDIRVRVLHCSVGDVTENDIMLASASDAVVLAFRVSVSDAARAAAKAEGVQIQSYDVIYHATEDIQRSLHGLLEPVFLEVQTAKVEVRKVFDLSVGTVAGCFVVEGTIGRDNKVRVVRDGTVVHDGELQSLKRVKDEVREVRAGFECGILLRDYKDVHEGDRLEAYKMERQAQTPFIPK
ncbi:translation initiation factor IF-2 [bacterium]|nr:translation initiation factor IF-2 [bacterium]